jgi:hypothetical protein
MANKPIKEQQSNLADASFARIYDDEVSLHLFLEKGRIYKEHLLVKLYEENNRGTLGEYLDGWLVALVQFKYNQTSEHVALEQSQPEIISSIIEQTKMNVRQKAEKGERLSPKDFEIFIELVYQLLSSQHIDFSH